MNNKSAKHLLHAKSAMFRRSTTRGFLQFAFDATLVVPTYIATLMCHSLLIRVILPPVQGLLITRLFVIGPDASHNGLTPHRSLNRTLSCRREFRAKKVVNDWNQCALVSSSIEIKTVFQAQF